MNEKIFSWSDIHQNHLKRAIEEVMMTEGGLIVNIKCYLADESPKAINTEPEQRLVRFDFDFVLHRTKELLRRLTASDVELVFKKILQDRPNEQI